MAPRGDEGRDKLRKAAEIGTYELTRRFPNETTRHREAMSSRLRSGGEPGELKHLSTWRKRK